MAISKKKRIKLLKGYDRIVLLLEKRFQKVMLKILLAQSDAIKKSFLKYMSEKKDDNGMSGDEADKTLKDLLDKILKDIQAVAGVQTIMKELVPLWLNAGEVGNKFFNAIQFTNPEDGALFAVFRDDYLTWLETYGTQMITYVNQTTKTITQGIIREGLISGDSINTIANTLTKELEEYSKRRSITIAVTEIHNSYQRGNFMSAEANGFKNKTWISAGDNHVRQSHIALNNKTVKMDADFKLGLGYPGDPRARASETINCRCILFYT